MGRIRFKYKKKYNIKLSLIIFVITAFTIFLIVRFSYKISTSVVSVSQKELSKINDYILLDMINNKSIFDLKNLLVIEQNNDGEILYVDYDVEKSYDVLRKITTMLSNNYSELEKGNKEILKNYKSNIIKYDNNETLLFIPSGFIMNNAFFSGLGPLIPIRLMVNGSVRASLKTDVSSYGINNAIIKLFINIELEQNLLLPYETKSVITKRELLISSKVIEGTVPNFYGGMLGKSTPFISN